MLISEVSEDHATEDYIKAEEFILESSKRYDGNYREKEDRQRKYLAHNNHPIFIEFHSNLIYLPFS